MVVTKSFRHNEWRRLHIKTLVIFVFTLWCDNWIQVAELDHVKHTAL